MNNREARQAQTELELGVLSPIITGAGVRRIMAEHETEYESPEDREYAVRRLEAEERRSEPTPIQERRQRLQQRIIDNAVLESPHRHYFVRKPGL